MVSNGDDRRVAQAIARQNNNSTLLFLLVAALLLARHEFHDLGHDESEPVELQTGHGNLSGTYKHTCKSL